MCFNRRFENLTKSDDTGVPLLFITSGFYETLGLTPDFSSSNVGPGEKWSGMLLIQDWTGLEEYEKARARHTTE